MSRLRLCSCLVTVLCCSVSACTDDLAGEGDTQGAGDGDGDGDAETSGGDGDGDGDVCKIAETSEIEGCAEIIGEGFCSEGGIHVEQGSDIEWTNNPPHSGDHYPTWETWGEHETPVARGHWVHNMEHGAIVLVYNCPEGCEAELELLREVMAAVPDRRMLMTEDPLLDGPRFAAVAWNWVYEFDAPDMDALVCFVEQHYNHAPESVL
ncbi:hypothetical protein ENSA5_31310 [Enhygromyxa salina]|uniref:DUF3105 domain-containing protein n=1 Tax=Enhygromyxa salina TaxID=215803 RepID=A0A2S9XYF4_9BACT|nr:DUF3105 domain-containing protein [Enhygromyxa salina]PRP97898.1 hypothetical protein ENSA5_31310 [Enhygromyxa salina]